MFSIGLTGGIGSGKSVVGQILSAMGYAVFHSDHAAKTIMNSHPAVRQALINRFGEQAYSNGALNRSFLAERIFSNEDEIQFLNQLVHPLVRQAYVDFKHSSDSLFVFNEAAILFETGASSNFDKMILVTAPEALRTARVMKRDGVSQEDVLRRMKNQWDDDKKVARADIVITNDDKSPLIAQVEEMLLAFSKELSNG